MADPEFEKLVQRFAERQQRIDAEDAVDWEEMKNCWVQTVHGLFNQIDGWLHSLIQSGSVKSIRKTTKLIEESLGAYDIESLEIQLAARKLTFEPVGTMLIGAFGRIEVSGPTGKAVLLLLNPDNKVPPKERRAHAAWFITHPALSSRSLPRNRPELRPMTQNSFQQLFTDLFGINR
ncbi:MAG: hypothetical protein JWO52_6255 [Gammaproteobacteria bacterium]|nr:hypothetical protein [Gammaproteobacteria bacterium]